MSPETSLYILVGLYEFLGMTVAIAFGLLGIAGLLGSFKIADTEKRLRCWMWVLIFFTAAIGIGGYI